MRLWDDELDGLREEVRNLLQYLPDISEDESVTGLDMPARAAAMRQGFDAAVSAGAAEPPASLEISTIPGPAGDIPVRIFRPAGEPTGLYLQIHGGGFVLGTAALSDQGNAALAEHHGLAVLSVDYRKAPEHPYPAAPDDCEAAARWLLDHGPSELGADRLVIGGESAGGHLALVTALRVRDRVGAIDRVAGLNLVFGWYDLTLTPSARVDGQVDMLSSSGLSFMADCFTQGLDAEGRRAGDVSPLYADLAGLPPALLSVGTNDHLLDDSLFLAGRLAAAGVDTQLEVYPDCPHGFMALPTEMTKAWAARTAGWLGRVLG